MFQTIEVVETFIDERQVKFLMCIHMKTHGALQLDNRGLTLTSSMVLVIRKILFCEGVKASRPSRHFLDLSMLGCYGLPPVALIVFSIFPLAMTEVTVSTYHHSTDLFELKVIILQFLSIFSFTPNIYFTCMSSFNFGLLTGRNFYNSCYLSWKSLG